MYTAPAQAQPRFGSGNPPRAPGAKPASNSEHIIIVPALYNHGSTLCIDPPVPLWNADETKHLNSIIDSVPEAKLEKIRRDPALCANGIALPKLQISQKRQLKEYGAAMIQLYLEQYPEFRRDHRDFRLKAQWLAQTHGSSLEERRWEGDDYFDCLAVTDDP